MAAFGNRHHRLARRLCVFILTSGLAVSSSVIGTEARGGPFYSGRGSHLGGATDPVFTLVVSDGYTRSIIARINDGNSHCSSLEPVYRIDCLRASYEWVAAQAERLGPDYREAATILNGLSRDLGRVVDQNLDRQAPRARSPRPTIRRTDLEYRAVRRSDLAKANQQAQQAIDKAVNALQRAKSAALAPHYQRIAQAVASSKLLLRSA
ncbi:hypothetical protein [Jiella sonneratiae]|uniref:Secreted protein n=1 Tax=Jiella sonneratiae TaxID=2816856 RepID=A0ABS3J810_9HYPH|nr:hypothetical protein [Jiella sonneratiae]MBO0905804.1 hypothetical protein [Jiella sonneratiae]